MGEWKKDHVVEQLAVLLQRKGWRMACAESCTGGWIAKACTDLAGSSAWFDRAYVSYSDAAKVDMLQVKPATLRLHGAVSEAVARQMAQGALRSARADAALAVTGIAGPDGGSQEKPVGCVWFAWAVRGRKTEAECVQFAGDRKAVRRQSVMHALEGLVYRLETFAE